MGAEGQMLNRVKPGFCFSLARLVRFRGLLVTLGACGPHVEGHAVATHTAADAKHIDASVVRVSAVAVPEGASELGIVQAHTVQGSIEDAMPEFRKQVAQLGGDFGKINDVATTFEMQMRTRTESYNCGTSDKPRTCTRTVTERVELATTRIIGKAFRLGVPTAKTLLTRDEAAALTPPPTQAAPPSALPETAPTAAPPAPEGAPNAP